MTPRVQGVALPMVHSTVRKEIAHVTFLIKRDDAGRPPALTMRGCCSIVDAVRSVTVAAGRQRPLTEPGPLTWSARLPRNTGPDYSREKSHSSQAHGADSS